MRPIKFRYTFKLKETGFVVVKIFFIEQLEGWAFRHWFDKNAMEDFELIARDQFIGHTDRNNRDIFENDTIKFDKAEWYRSTSTNWETMPDHYEKVVFDSEYLAMRKNDFSRFCEVVDNPELLKNNQGEGNEGH